MPLSYHIAQELQKYNIPDYRPRQEQYVPPFSLILRPILTGLVDFKKQSKKSARCSACVGIAVSHLVRRRMGRGRIRQG